MSERVSLNSSTSGGSEDSQPQQIDAKLAADGKNGEKRNSNSDDKPKPKVHFYNRVENDFGTSERLKDHEVFKMKLEKSNTVEKRFKNFKKQFLNDDKFYQERMKPSEDELVEAFVTELNIKSLKRVNLISLFSKYRELRELQVRIRNLEALRIYRAFLGKNKLNLALNMIQFLEAQSSFLNEVEKEDYTIRGISPVDKEKILKNIELDPDNEEECDKWVSYILFFSNPTNEWGRLKGRFEKVYFKFLDTAIIQSMVNNNVDAVLKLMKRKLPKFLKNHPDAKFTPLMRADRSFSSYKRNTCPSDCTGHRGKLLLLMIRMNHLYLVEKCLDQGISIGSRCCTGQIRLLFWDQDRKMTVEDEKPDKKSEKKKKAKGNKAKIALRSQFEYETPLSTAVMAGSLDLVKLLLQKGASPLHAKDAALRACVEGVIERYKEQEKAKEKGKRNNDQVISMITDNAYIFNLICQKSTAKMNNSASAKKGMKRPNYCTVVLLYQAVKEELWDAEEILTHVRGAKGVAQSKGDLFQETLTAANINNTLPVENNTVSGEGMKKLLKMAKKGTRRVSSNNKSKSRFARKGVRGTFKKVRSSIYSATGSVQKQVSSAMSVSSYGTVVSTKDGDHVFVKDMNQDLCYIILRVVDKLLLDLLAKDSHNLASHERELNGILTLIEKHNLYLDDIRFSCLVRAAVGAMANSKPGDSSAVQRLFNNKQIRHYLKLDFDASWEKRRAALFIKHSYIKKLLNLEKKKKQKLVKEWDKKYLAGGEENLLEVVLLHAARLNMPNLIEDLRNHDISPDDEYMAEVMAAATQEEAIEAMEIIVKCYGKELLRDAFHVALTQSYIGAIQKVLELDGEIQDSSYSLVESYIGNALIKKTKKRSGNEGEGEFEGEVEEEEEDDGTPPVEVVLDFFFLCVEMSREKILKILTECFSSRKNIDFVAVAHLLAKSTQLYPDLIPSSLLDTYLKTKSVQFDGKPEQTQVLWLRLLLDLYKCAVNSGEDTVEADYNDKVVSLLELKPKYFGADINYENESVESGLEVDDEELTEYYDVDDEGHYEGSEYL
eukprot:maker-scaffold_5-snap-gene-10.64-mRNA-1 protein AED:0.38 eAED:0.38 QI:205/0.5/0.33/0.66/1/1/3/0/1057